MSSQVSKSKRSGLPAPKKKTPSENGGAPKSKSSSGERTVKKLRLTKALTIPDGTTVADACKRMVIRRVDAALLTDSSGLLCGIITDKDVSTRVIAENLKPEETSVSKVMTTFPVFVNSDVLAVDALQKMVQGKFRHLPVVENGEVVALLDITKCLYDAIARMEKAAEKGNAIAAAVETVERQWGNTLTSSTFIDTLRDRMFRPTLGTLLGENTKVATVAPSDTILTATRKMREFRMNSVIITTNNKPQGILTSKDVLVRVVAPGLPPDTTTVDKVMTPNPECATMDTTIVDALHTMHDGKFLHIPVVDREGLVVACLDVLQLTHGAVATVGNVGGGTTPSETGSTMMQKFWDSAFALDAPEDDEDTQSNLSASLMSDTFHGDGRMVSYPSSGPASAFNFKLTDRSGRVHRFNCGTESLTELISAVIQRLGDDTDRNKPPQVLYEDDEGDRVLLSCDSDLVAAINFAKTAGLKGLKLHLDYPKSEAIPSIPENGVLVDETSTKQQNVKSSSWTHTHTIVLCSAAVVTVGLVVYLRSSKS